MHQLSEMGLKDEGTNKKVPMKLTLSLLEFQINWLEYIETLFENIRDDIRQVFEKGEPIIINNMKQFEAVLKVVATVDQKIFGMFILNVGLSEVVFERKYSIAMPTLEKQVFQT